MNKLVLNQQIQETQVGCKKYGFDPFRLKTAVFRNVPRFPVPTETSDHKLVFQPLGSVVDVNFQLSQRKGRLCKAQASKCKKNLRCLLNHIHFLIEVLYCTVCICTVYNAMRSCVAGEPGAGGRQSADCLLSDI